VLCLKSLVRYFGNSTCPAISTRFLNKSEYRNPKSETISKSKCQKFKTNADNYLSFIVFWKFEFRSFEFVSSFDLPAIARDAGT